MGRGLALGIDETGENVARWAGRLAARLRAVPEASYGPTDKKLSKDDLKVYNLGKEVFNREAHCGTCHQPDGKGMPPAFPALSGSKIVTGPLLSPDGKLLKDSHVDRVLNGKEGTAMQAFRNTLNDVELAAVITYERNALGNSKGDLIQPAQIKALR